MKAIERNIYNYWTGRAQSYSEYNKSELADERREKWRSVLLREISKYVPGKEPKDIQVLDAGCGPGFFSLLLAEAGFAVTAVDTTEAMLYEARKNAGELARSISWVLGDVQLLDFHSERFDVVVTRNVTWNLPDPKAAYAEWFRVLKPTGVLLNFDADWYGYLFDEEKKAAYEQDRKNSAEQNREDCNVGENFDVMEDIARRIPMSSLRRPQWDMDTAKECGFHDILCQEDIWQEVWSEDEKVSCASTPMFLLAARKQDPKQRVVRYWTMRSEGFFQSKKRELNDPIADRWLAEILPALPAGEHLRILDVGCGAGFFSVLLARQGHIMTGIDLTPEMIDMARLQAQEDGVEAEFMIMDAENPNFPEGSFDAIVTRNVTWTLPHPDVAYKNWLRLLRKGGVIVNVDGDYGLEDTTKMHDLPDNHAHHKLGLDTMIENNAIKALLPISYHRRPMWDMGYLMSAGVEKLSVDTGISKRLYIVKDEHYNPTPVFLIRAEKS